MVRDDDLFVCSKTRWLCSATSATRKDSIKANSVMSLGALPLGMLDLVAVYYNRCCTVWYDGPRIEHLAHREPIPVLPFRDAVRNALTNTPSDQELLALVMSMHTFLEQEKPESLTRTACELETLGQSSEEVRTTFRGRTLDHTRRTLLRLNSGIVGVGWVA